jgi:S1-C subfamily serine protease
MAGQVIGIASRILTKSGGFEGLGFVVESFLVQQVANNSPAARLGIQPGEIKSQIGEEVR